MKKKADPKGLDGKPFTSPVLCTENNSDWYIYFEFLHNGNWHKRKLRENMNRISNTAERTKFGEALAAARLKWLEAGWNPIADPKFKLINVAKPKERQNMTLKAAIKFGLEKKSQAKKGKATYESALNFIIETAEKTGHAYLPISEIDRTHCLDLLDACKEGRNFSNKNYNKHLETLRAIFTECVQWRLMLANPLLNTRAKPVTESNLYAPYTEEEKAQISEHLHRVCYRLYVVMQVVYHTGIRPKEALALHIDEIDLKEDIITIAPDEDRENSKTPFVRRVPINQHLKALLLEMGLHRYPGHYFVFGSPFKPGAGNRGKGSFHGGSGKHVGGAMRSDYFMPHPTPVNRDTVTRLWKKLIIDDAVYHPETGERVEASYKCPISRKKIKGSLGIGIKKKLYAAKRTGGRDYLKAGVKVNEMKVVYGHTTEKMTQVYTRDAEELTASESVKQKAPIFTSSATPTISKFEHWPLYPYIWARCIVKLVHEQGEKPETDLLGKDNFDYVAIPNYIKQILPKLTNYLPYINKQIEIAKEKKAPLHTYLVDTNNVCRSIVEIDNDDYKFLLEFMANEYLTNIAFYK